MTFFVCFTLGFILVITELSARNGGTEMKYVHLVFTLHALKHVKSLERQKVLLAIKKSQQKGLNSKQTNDGLYLSAKHAIC